MLLIDAFFRFSGIGLLLFTMALIFRDLPRSTSSYLLLLTTFSLFCHYLGFTPIEFELQRNIWVLLRIIDVSLLVFVWLFALSLFQKDFRINAIHILFACFIGGAMLAERFVQFGWVDGLPSWWAHLVNTSAIAVMIHLFIVTYFGRNDDLLEKRRASRLYLVYIIAGSVFLTVLLGSIILPQYQATINVISIWPTVVAIGLWLIKVDGSAFIFDSPNQVKQENLSSRDVLLSENLNTAIIENKSYLENNLSVDQLARKLGVGAPRLRVFINQKLGFTNFSSYINSYRIEAIKQALDSTDNDHVPILTLALNHGFNSLPPFNRAFKKKLGMTPSEYRNKSRNHNIDQH